jgi:uncharacterized protein YpuA (DUF1002 family)
MLNNIRWSKQKEPGDIPVTGVTVDVEWADSNVTAVTITDEDGNAIRITKAEYSGMQILVPSKITKYRLSGVIGDTTFDQTFDTKDEAKEHKERLEELAHGTSYTLDLREIQVPA